MRDEVGELRRGKETGVRTTGQQDQVQLGRVDTDIVVALAGIVVVRIAIVRVVVVVVTTAVHRRSPKVVAAPATL